MKQTFLSSAFTLVFMLSAVRAAPVPLSDGKSFDGWEGDTAKTWRVEDGAFVGGSLKEKVPHNEFLATQKSFRNFELRLKFKLTGTEGFVNGGVQFRSERIPNHFEMKGYQADMGDPAWWGCLYDESRRNKVLVQAPADEVKKVLKHDDWNEYRVRCEGPRIQLWINGLQTVDYTEPDAAIPQEGKIAVQIHGGGKSEAWYKDITVEELPDSPAPNTAPVKPETKPATPAAAKSGGYDRPAGEKAAEQGAIKDGPRTADRERASFHLPDGFVAELVADESVMKKAVSFNFDTAGRMWVTTASEYPLDGNEQPERAAALYRDGGRDNVLIFDTPWAAGLQRPRVFAGAEGDAGGSGREPGSAGARPLPPGGEIRLAMPMGVLPYKDGAIVHHGPDLLFLRDTDGDGKADKKEVLLTGFGTQDSHLMPHGFTRGPGDWIYFAQGAFNTSDVKTKEGTTVHAAHCKLFRMKPDGSYFQVALWGQVKGASLLSACPPRRVTQRHRPNWPRTGTGSAVFVF